jgi:deoxyadenosine/deoxycytidine kinase
MDFLVKRYEQLHSIDVAGRETVVADYIFEKDKLFACVNLTDAELALYNRYYDLFRKDLPTPDLVIYLQASPEALKRRLKRKNIADEQEISTAYIEEIVRAYEHFFFHYTASDLLVVNTNDIDFVERNADLNELLRRLDEPIKGSQYFLPLAQQEDGQPSAIPTPKTGKARA